MWSSLHKEAAFSTLAQVIKWLIIGLGLIPSICRRRRGFQQFSSKMQGFLIYSPFHSPYMCTSGWPLRVPSNLNGSNSDSIHSSTVLCMWGAYLTEGTNSHWIPQEHRDMIKKKACKSWQPSGKWGDVRTGFYGLWCRNCFICQWCFLVAQTLWS